MTTSALVIRLALVSIGAYLAGQRIWRYRAARRTGRIPPNPRLLRAGRALGVGIASFLVSFVLLPLRIAMGWPRWLAYPLFIPLLVGLGCVYYSAFLFWGAKTEPRA